MRRWGTVALSMLTLVGAHAASAVAKSTLNLTEGPGRTQIKPGAVAELSLGKFVVSTKLGNVECPVTNEGYFEARDLSNNLPTDAVEIPGGHGDLGATESCPSTSQLGAASYVGFQNLAPGHAEITLAAKGKTAFIFPGGVKFQTYFPQTESVCYYAMKTLKGTIENLNANFEDFAADSVRLNFKAASLKLLKTESNIDCPTKAGLEVSGLRFIGPLGPKDGWDGTTIG